MTKSSGRWLITSALLLLMVQTGFCEDDSPVPSSHPTSAWIVSPLFGVAKNEDLTKGVTDSSPEYGLFAMYAAPRFIVNNTTFSPM